MADKRTATKRSRTGSKDVRSLHAVGLEGSLSFGTYKGGTSMVLVKLELAAFLPFREKQVVDFGELLQDHVFLICGATGSGKTSLFDAICFALFGRTSGSIRDVATLKSQFAEDREKAYVTLTFSVNRETYEVYRTPIQARVGRGGKRMIDPASARLTLPNGEILSGVREVDRRLEEVLGITLAQFRKIIMLPQGEFQRFLVDSSTAKQEILKNIFDTAPYAAIETHLREEYGREKENMTALRARLSASLGEMRCFLPAEQDLPSGKEPPPLVEQLRDLLEAETPAYEHILRVGNELREEIKATLAAKVTAVSASQTALFAIDPDLAAKHNQQLERLWETRYTYDALLEQTDVMLKCRQEVEQLQQLQGIVQQKKQLQQKEEMLERVKTALARQQEALPPLEKSLVCARDALEKAEKIQRGLPDRFARLAVQEQQLALFAKELEVRQAEQKATEQQRQLAVLSAAFALAEQVAGYCAERTHLLTIGEAITRTEQADVAYLAKKEVYQQQFQAFIVAQAGLLSQHLVAGEACPVCGSTDHPTPATTLAEGAVSEETLAEARTQYEVALARLSQAQTELTSLWEGFLANLTHSEEGNASYERKRQLIAERDATLSREVERINQERSHMLSQTPQHVQQSVAHWGREDYLRQTEKLEGKLSDLSAQRIALHEQTKQVGEEASLRKRLAAEKASIQTDQTAYEESSRLEGSLRENLARHREAITLYGKQEAELTASIAHDKGEITAQLAQLSLDEEHLTAMMPRVEQLAQLTQTWQAWEAACENQRGRLLAYEEESKGLHFQDLPALREQKQEAEQHYRQLREQQRQLEQTDTLTGQALVRFATSYADYGQAGERFEQMGRLYQVAAGNAGGRVSFERYVLGIYFDRVIHHANQRLTSLTDGRYQLRRREEAEKGNTSSGLELEVFDAQNGRYRHVNMVSGGESFQMALALALGFADVITQESGGTGLSTLLIDEGFGTLDQEALDQAIGVLTRLKNQGKQIGMISHVRELQERVRHKLLVEQTKQGSACRFVVD